MWQLLLFDLNRSCGTGICRSRRERVISLYTSKSLRSVGTNGQDGASWIDFQALDSKFVTTRPSARGCSAFFLVLPTCWSSISPAMVKNSAFVFIKPGVKDYSWFIVLPRIPICALDVYDSEWEESVGTISRVLCVGAIGARFYAHR